MSSGGSDSATKTPSSEGTPLYYQEAIKWIGTKETLPSGRNNPTVVKWLKDVTNEKYDSVSTPWCAAFVGAMLQETGYASTKKLNARSYKNYGYETDVEEEGNIVVLWRGKKDDGITGHVGFLVAWDKTHYWILGGNQSDSVNIQKFPRSRVLTMVVPRPLKNSRTVIASATGAVSEATRASTDWVTTVSTTVEAVKEPATQLAQFVPWIKAVLAVVTIASLIAVAYFRWDDYHNKGR